MMFSQDFSDGDFKKIFKDVFEGCFQKKDFLKVFSKDILKDGLKDYLKDVFKRLLKDVFKRLFKSVFKRLFQLRKQL